MSFNSVYYRSIHYTVSKIHSRVCNVCKSDIELFIYIVYNHLNIMYTVCTVKILYIIQCTSSSVHCTLYSVHYTVNIVHLTIYTVFNVLCSLSI